MHLADLNQKATPMSLDSVALSSTVRLNQLLLQSATFAPGKKVNSALNNPTKIVTAAGPDPRPIKNSLNVFSIHVSMSSIGLQARKADDHNTMDQLHDLVDSLRLDLKLDLVQTQGKPPPGYSQTGYWQKASLTLDAPAGADAAGALGTATDLTNAGYGTANSLDGKTIVLKTSATATTTIRLGAAAGQVNSIDALNSALSKAGVQLTASYDATTGKLALTSTDDAASQTITKTGAFTAAPAGSSSSVDISGTIGATATVIAPVADTASQNLRAREVARYNATLRSITDIAKDNNLRLNGELLKLDSDQIGNSSVTSITSVTLKGLRLDAKGFGLRDLTAGTDLIDNVSISKAIAALDVATATLSSLDPASNPYSRIKLYGGFDTLDFQHLSTLIEKRLGIGELVQFEPRHALIYL
jgi:hypothetical protein